jgi:hypothetical protein
MNRKIYAAIALVVAVNAVVFAGVLYNRSGEPDSSVELTERELTLGSTDQENSGMTLYLNWKGSSPEETEWFNKEKLAEAGFDCSIAVDSPKAALHYAKALPRKTYAVFEYEGAAWYSWQAREKQKIRNLSAEVASGKATVKSLEEAMNQLAWKHITESRLFFVDVGNDPKKLRERYIDKNRCLIMPVLVRLNLKEAATENGNHEEPRVLTGSLDKVLTDTIQVPHDKQRILIGTSKTGGIRNGLLPYLKSQGADKPPSARYAVTLNYGKRFEPWVASVRSLAK